MNKKLQVVALPITNAIATPRKDGGKTDDVLWSAPYKKADGRWYFPTMGTPYGAMLTGNKPHHLYITNNEEIKEGDWVIEYDPTDGNSHAFQCKDWQVNKVNKGICAPNCRKVVATTNPDLWQVVQRVHNLKLYEGRWSIPKIPQSFVQAFVKAQGMSEVMVEYTVSTWTENGRGEEPKNMSEEILKLNLDGDIIWKQVNERTWTDDDVIHILYGAGQHLTFASMSHAKKWFNDNYPI